MEMKGINQMKNYYLEAFSLIVILFLLFAAIVVSQEKPEVKIQNRPALAGDSIQVLILAKLDSIGSKISYLKLRDKQFTQYQEAVKYFNDTVLVIIQRAIDSLYIEKETLKRYLNGH
jgi:hypothetical protein